MGMTQRDVMGREVGGGSCLGTHVRIKDFKIKKKKKHSESTHHPIPCLQSVMQEKQSGRSLLLERLLICVYKMKTRS